MSNGQNHGISGENHAKLENNQREEEAYLMMSIEPDGDTTITDFLNNKDKQSATGEEKQEQLNANGTNKLSRGFDAGKLNFTKHENKNIIEILINGILIAKNKDDDLINVTQIINLAGLNEEESDKILSTEAVNERTEIDDGKYKGIWIKTQHAVEIAKKLQVEKPLQPLIKEYDFNQLKKSLNSRTYSTLTENDDFNPTTNDIESPSKKLKTASNNTSTSGNGSRSGSSSNIGSASGLGIHSRAERANTIADTLETTTKYALEPMDVSHVSNYDQLKEMLTQIFISENDSISEACGQLSTNNVNLDLPIDPQGHTVLHWAASLANIPLVYELVNLGANLNRGNLSGETALMRAVAHTNFYEEQSFGKLLDILYPSINVLDNRHRSILHHIVLTAGIEGRNEAAKYYIQCLVEWIIKSGPTKFNAISLAGFMSEIVNLKDHNGDTALNIIARIGNKAIAQQLLDVGADPKLPNKAGLTPADFRLSGVSLPNGGVGEMVTGVAKNSVNNIGEQLDAFLGKNSSTATKNNKALLQAFSANDDAETTKKLALGSKEVLGSMREIMNQLNSDFEAQLGEKQKELNVLYKNLKESTIKLSQSRIQLEILKNSESKLNELKQKTANIEKSIQEEETNFVSQYPEAANQGFDINTSYDPDQPFKVPSIYHEVKLQIENQRAKLPKNDNNNNANDLDLAKIDPSSIKITPDKLINLNVDINDIPPTYVLKARIKAYKENEKFLQNLASNLDHKSIVLEDKFRHVVSLCTGVEENKVDDLLEGLVQAVESDPDEVDLGRVAGFLTKVDEEL